MKIIITEKLKLLLYRGIKLKVEEVVVVEEVEVQGNSNR